MRFIHYTATELNAYQEKLKHDGTTDELTGLYNRRVLNTEIDTCLQLAKDGQQIYIVILDLDLFKEINDTHGHDVGDDVLIMLSEGLIKCSGSADICTRSGGDEFIVVLMESSKEQVIKWYRSISDYMEDKVRSYCADKNITIEFGISAGCTLISITDLKTAVLKRADEALYKVKENNKNDIEFL